MPVSRAPRLLLVLLGALLAIAAHSAPPGPAEAGSLTFAVSNPTHAPDAPPGAGVCATAAGPCTLRAAIDEANAQPMGSTITITVPAGHYRLTLGELALISNTIVISGAGAGTTTVDGGGASRVVHVFGAGVA